jgi:hypothetical protein
MKKITLLLIAILCLTAGCQRMPTVNAVSVFDDKSIGNLVINDDFENPAEEWCESGLYSFGQSYCRDGELHLINQGVGNVTAMTDGNFKDFRLQVQMRSIGDSGSYGVEFRGQETLSSYYIFRIRPGGQYQLIKWSPSQPDTVLIPWTNSTVINKGQLPNLLEVTALGSQISLSVNNARLADIMDTSFTEGLVGPVASEQGHAAVSTMKVWEILIRNGDLIHNRM